MHLRIIISELFSPYIIYLCVHISNVCCSISMYVCKLHPTAKIKIKITAQLKFSVFCSTESLK